jgi:proteasome beta subunit
LFYGNARRTEEKILRIKETGTTTVGLVFREGIVFATDQRVTAGHYIAHKHGKKVHMIDSHAGITISGVVADAQAVIDILRYHAKLYRIERGRPMPIRSIATLASNVFFTYRLFPLIADVLIGGVDESGPSLFNIDFFGSLTNDNYISTGSGSPIAYGILESEFKPGMSREEATKLAIKAVFYAMRRDSASGDGIDVAIVDTSGYKELSLEEKKRILSTLT